jgi:hypothetical protein
MRCLCPKCNAHVELDLENIPEEGSFKKCPECNAGFLVNRVSFAQRALHKGDEITCAECGTTLGTAIFCQNCHAIYPDFYVTEASSAAKKQVGKIFGFLNKLNGASGRTTGKAASTDYGSVATPKGKGLKLSGLAAALSVLVVLAIGGGYFWYQNKIETAYAENYVRTLYVIKSAADFDLQTCTRIATDWKTSMTPNPPQPKESELTGMKRGDGAIETQLQSIGETPEKFKANRDDITKLAGVYKKLHAFATHPSGSIDSFAATTTQLDDEFRKSADSLKSRLPEKISATLADSKKKYKALEDF